jgi:hypothetical protein
VIASCKTSKRTADTQNNSAVSLPGPKVIIYQTKKDYANYVPVTLSEDKKSIVSYPDIKDVYFNGSLAYPTQLHNGYLLDNRGINKDAAFLTVTYEEFSKLPKTPDSEQLLKMILDKDPIVKMYSCGVKSTYKDVEQELNAKIDADDFTAFTRIK